MKRWMLVSLAIILTVSAVSAIEIATDDGLSMELSDRGEVIGLTAGDVRLPATAAAGGFQYLDFAKTDLEPA